MFQLYIATLIKLTPLLLLAKPVSAVGCFSSGQQESAGAVVGAISAACDTLAGTYVGGQIETACENLSDGNRVNFEIALAGGAATTSISVSDCIAQNTDTAAGCDEHGGIRQFNQFQLTLDPNTGAC